MNPYKGKAEYECLSCEKKFNDDPGPTSCPYCGAAYVRWLNYERWAQ